MDLSRFQIIEKTFSTLKLAVHPVDRAAATPAPVGRLAVNIPTLSLLPGSSRGNGIRNSGGFHVFFELEDITYRVAVDAQYYISKTFEVTLPSNGLSRDEWLLLDDEVILFGLTDGLLAEVRLLPDVTYPFPAGATLVLVEVGEGADNTPVADAGIEIIDLDDDPAMVKVTLRSGIGGQSVIFCNRIKSDEIVEICGRPYSGSRNVRIRAVHPVSGNTGQIDVQIEDGNTISGAIQL